MADTLRQEVLRYNTSDVTYKVHCAFPGNFATPSFIEEQQYKPELTKQLEGSNKHPEEVLKSTPSPAKVAQCILDGIRKDDFAIGCDSECSLLLNNMLGPTPRRGLGILDSLFAVIAWIVWPFIRRQHDADCQKDGKRN